ncbi:MAG TPA: TMEM175 family protein [Alphaproteobacteria bacterium]|nr:TMEM175 family protein [Alphaproteobacteria bacterium]
MSKNRMEAFSDGVIAIIITIMVLEMRVPHEPTFEALRPLWPVFACYVLSFTNLGVWWSNHHHLLHASQHINGGVLWANLHLLFWLSLIPFVTGWMGENHFAPASVAAYGIVALMAGVAYSILTRALIAADGKGSVLAGAIGRDMKGNLSLAFYAAAIGFAFVLNWISLAFYVLVALMWLVPDRRIEKRIAS